MKANHRELNKPEYTIFEIVVMTTIGFASGVIACFILHSN